MPISLPGAFRRARLRPINVVGASASPWTLQQQVFAHQGQAWSAEVSYPVKKRADAEPVLAALLSLNGPAGTFYLGDPLGQSPRGSTLGTPLVDGAGQSGQLLATKGWTASASGVLLAGDYIQLGSGETQRLYKVTADVDADGAGLADLPIWPRLRESPSDGAALTTSACEGVFNLPEDFAGWEETPGGLYQPISFTAIETLRP